MTDGQLNSLVNRVNIRVVRGHSSITLRVEDFEIVPGFSRQVITIHAVYDPAGWNSERMPDGTQLVLADGDGDPKYFYADFSAECQWLNYSVTNRRPNCDQADEAIVVG